MQEIITNKGEIYWLDINHKKYDLDGKLIKQKLRERWK